VERAEAGFLFGLPACSAGRLVGFDRLAGAKQNPVAGLGETDDGAPACTTRPVNGMDNRCRAFAGRAVQAGPYARFGQPTAWTTAGWLSPAGRNWKKPADDSWIVLRLWVPRRGSGRRPGQLDDRSQIASDDVFNVIAVAGRRVRSLSVTVANGESENVMQWG
jgi:hypothetical protein